MRAMFMLFLFPLSCYGISPDSCWHEGDLNGKKVTLHYIQPQQGESVDAVGIPNDPKYGYCLMGAIDNYYNMSCAAKAGGQQTVYYDTNTPKNNHQTYVCKKGCNANVVKVFVEKCGNY